jgi:hypothetical protein
VQSNANQEDHLNAPALIQHLEDNAAVIHGLFHGTSKERASWRPTPESWSTLEVLLHLLDEEREDFRVRLDYTLHRPESPWPPIDPVGWVEDRAYARQDLEESLRVFLEERRKSVAWLRGLTSPDWDSAHVHPKFGAMNAGTLLASWVAHDFLHMRQVTRIRFEHVRHLAGSHSVRYAGDW